MPQITSSRYVWVADVRRFGVAHEPGPAHFTMCGIVMRGAGHTILSREARDLVMQRCPSGCFQSPIPKYRTKQK